MTKPTTEELDIAQFGRPLHQRPGKCAGCKPFTLCEEGTPCFNLSCARLGCALNRQREADKHTAGKLPS